MTVMETRVQRLTDIATELDKRSGENRDFIIKLHKDLKLIFEDIEARLTKLEDKQ